MANHDLIGCNIACDILSFDVRLVFDTTTVIAAIRSDAGASRRVLVAGLKRRFTMLVSVPLLIEYEAVMTQQEHLVASRMSVADVAILLDAVVAVAERVALKFLWRPLLSDADDDMVLETAANGRADAIVTFNRRHFAPVTGQFGIDVLSPSDAVYRLEKTS